MSKILSILPIILLTLTMNAQEPVVKSKMEGVTVFRSGAQIKRTAKVALKPGHNTIVIGQLPSGYDESTIQIKSNARADILTVSFRNNFLTEFEADPAYKSLKDQLLKLTEHKENETVVFDTWREEEILLLNNKIVAGVNSGLNPDQLSKTADLYRTRLLQVKQNVLQSRRSLDKVNAEITKVQGQINDWTGKNKSTNSGEIVIEIMSPRAMEDHFEITYIDNRAYWTTAFDLRLENLKEPLHLITRGRIGQSTGESWENVSVTLSTGNPRLNTKAPELSPWFLYYLQTYASQNLADAYNKKAAAQMRNSNIRTEDESGAMMVESRENITFMEYTLPSKLTIPSGNKSQDVKIQELEIPAVYTYTSVPKMDPRVYLQAGIHDWSQYNLSSGEVKLYFEGTYIGTSYLDASQVADTLLLSLGPDIAVTTKREKLKDFTKTAFLSSKKQVQAGWEITVKNNKTTAIELTFTDQIPLSSDSQMEIEVQELSGGKLNKETGIVEWKATLKPGEQIKKKIIYSVKIPKEAKVSL